MNKTTIVVGAQFGDEGKGKITDLLAEKSDWVVRYGGGNNAGHTVVVNGHTYKFHLLPSGLARGKKSGIGAGCVIDPKVLVQELEQFGKTVPLHIDPRAQMILPYHILQDAAGEKKAGEKKIGTTGRGIGPCYSDRCLRIGIRFGDFVNPIVFRQRLQTLYENKKDSLESAHGKENVPLPEKIVSEYTVFAEKLKPYLADVSLLVSNALEKKEMVLFEGAQGAFLDNDFGTYPFVTSSHPLAGGAFVGVGIGPISNCRIVGVSKAYVTRVGSGPFPTELNDEIGEKIRQKGQEFGTTTGRPRRCGWLDLVQLRTAKRLNGLTELGLIKLDVLEGLNEIKVCTQYELNGQQLWEVPFDSNEWENCQPIYKSFKGFEVNPKAKKLEKLSKGAQQYVKFVEKELRIPVSIVSIGADREQTIVRR